MNKLGEQFKLNNNSIANNACVITGNNYRITVLTERMLRLEYNEAGIFEDRATELVINRKFDVPKFNRAETDKELFISTNYLKLIYQKNKPFQNNGFFATQSLNVEMLEIGKNWYYGIPEVRNYGSPSTELSSDNGKTKFRKSLYSLDGFVTIDDSNTKVFNDEGFLEKREIKGIDIYLIAYGNDFISGLKEYYKITGYPSLIPRYALGNWWYRNYAYTEEQLKKLVGSFYKNDIPLSVLLLNKEWHLADKNITSRFTFNKEKINDPMKFVDYLHSMGIRIGLSVNPMESIYTLDENAQELKPQIQDQKGEIPFSILNSECIKTYLNHIIHKLDNYNIDFYWIDFFDKNKLSELYALKHYHFYDMKKDYKKRSMVYAKNSLIAAHRYPILYSGESEVSWDTLRSFAFHNTNSTNMGITWWSHDIGGFKDGIEDNELYTRFVQFGTFSPILKFGCDASKFYKREPWEWSIKTYEITKKYLNLRHQLIPYIYSEAFINSKYGIPLITPLYYKKAELYDDPLYRNDYFFGSQLFVSPLTTSKDYIMNRVIHKFYIPSGIWYDFFTGKKFIGDKQYVSFFKDQDYPVFAKQGAIIPMGKNVNINDTTPPKDMEIQIFPGKSNLYKLYEDDGVSNLYEKDYYLMSTIEYNYMKNNYTVIINATEGKSGIIPDKRNYKFRFRNTKEADSVSVHLNNDKINCNSYVDKDDFIVEVQNVDTVGKQLTVNCKGNKIEIDAVRIINDDIEGIISDLPIQTTKKDKIAEILFGDLPINKKRIAIRRLSNIGIERKFIQLFLKLLEYVGQM